MRLLQKGMQRSRSEDSPPKPAAKEILTDPSLDPGENDVLLGRGKGIELHPGNVWFLRRIEESVHLYVQQERGTKQGVVKRTIDTVAERNGRFLKRNKEGKWGEASQGVIMAKVAQAFRHRRRTLVNKSQAHEGYASRDQTNSSTAYGYGAHNLVAAAAQDLEGMRQRDVSHSMNTFGFVPYNTFSNQNLRNTETGRMDQLAFSRWNQQPLSSGVPLQLGNSATVVQQPVQPCVRQEGNLGEKKESSQQYELFDAFDELSATSTGPQLLSDKDILRSIGEGAT